MKQRVLTALALIPPVLAALFLTNSLAIGLLAAAVILIGLSEIRRMLATGASIYVGLFLLFIYLLPGDAISAEAAREGRIELMVQWGVAHFILGVIAAAAIVAGKGRFLSFLAAGWVIGPMECLIALHGMHATSGLWSFATPVLLAIVPLWGGDTAAIFAGRAFGKHPLAPKISPKKTWEGGIANLFACIVVAAPLAMWIGYTLPVGIACGLAAGILGQAGDLFESWIKRKADLKDSGTILPGHGGVMDRIDSILFTAPTVALILTLAS